MIKLKDILLERGMLSIFDFDDTLVTSDSWVYVKRQPTINGKKMLSFRIKKLMPKKESVNEISKQKELSKIESWVRKSGMDYNDWDWDGKELTIFTKSGTEKYSKKDLKDERVFEGKLNEDSPYAVFKKIEKLKGGALLKFGNEIWVKIGNKKDQWLCKKGPEKGVISDSTVVAQRIFKVLGKKHKLLKIEGEVNEGRPIFQTTPNEFAYLDFKKWAYKNRKFIKKYLRKAVEAGRDPGTDIFLALRELWLSWATQHAKEWSRVPNRGPQGKDFGRALAVMMKKDNLIIKKSGNKLTDLEEKYNIRKSSCKQSDGDSGSYRLSYTTKKGKKRSACHTSKKKAKGQIAAIEAPPR